MYPRSLGETGPFDVLAQQDQDAWNATYLPKIDPNATGTIAPTVQTLPELVATAKIPLWAVMGGIALLMWWATGGKLGKGGKW